MKRSFELNALNNEHRHNNINPNCSLSISMPFLFIQHREKPHSFLFVKVVISIEVRRKVGNKFSMLQRSVTSKIFSVKFGPCGNRPHNFHTSTVGAGALYTRIPSECRIDLCIIQITGDNFERVNALRHMHAKNMQTKFFLMQLDTVLSCLRNQKENAIFFGDFNIKVLSRYS